MHMIMNVYNQSQHDEDKLTWAYSMSVRSRSSMQHISLRFHPDDVSVQQAYHEVQISRHTQSILLYAGFSLICGRYV